MANQVNQHVGNWPEGEVLTCVSNVCSPRNCGRDVLALSLTGFDPKRPSVLVHYARPWRSRASFTRSSWISQSHRIRSSVSGFEHHSNGTCRHCSTDNNQSANASSQEYSLVPRLSYHRRRIASS